jgi:hypothetical protein
LLKIEITPQQPTTNQTTPKGDPHCRELMLATTIHESNTTPHHQNLGQQHASHHTQWPGKHGPVVSKPNSVSDGFRRRSTRSLSMHQTRTHYRHEPSHDSSGTR